MLPPLKFRPLLKERVWGGRQLSELYRKHLPAQVPVGESWEVSDREGDVSVVAEGPLQERDLHWLMHQHGGELLGAAASQDGRFPLLIKILDAREVLSLQVHPPAAIAPALGGEPKTEMWYIASAEPGARLFAGLRRGITRADFENRLRTGRVSEAFHEIPVRETDALFLPSGRVHAIGGGLVIFEIQQNSDTTYRVYDWDRLGLDGKPRALHVSEALASIDFGDFEPALIPHAGRQTPFGSVRPLVNDALFQVEEWRLKPSCTAELTAGIMHILCAVAGRITVRSEEGGLELGGGETAVVPACLADARLDSHGPARVLRTTCVRA